MQSVHTHVPALDIRTIWVSGQSMVVYFSYASYVSVEKHLMQLYCVVLPLAVK